MAHIHVGTSGYSYPEWTAAGFYPPGTRSGHMLSLYAERFGTAELNFTWYQMPKAAALERMVDRTPESFVFSAKLNRTLTHEVEPDRWRQRAGQFREGIAPLILANRLAAILVQLPPSFHRTRENRTYLSRLLDALGDFPLAVEFRHVSWAEDRVFAELEKRRIALVSVDEPDFPKLFPPLAVVTHPGLFYVRFHGRNKKHWGSGNKQKQFDYDYSDAELSEWIEDRIAPMAETASSGLLYFNNHVGGQAARNAERMMHLLAERGLTEPPAWNDASSI